MTLEYLKEYRTYFHVGQSYGVSEGSALRYQGGKYFNKTPCALPRCKALLKNKTDYEFILIDAMESPIERSKKSKGGVLIWKEKET